MKFARPALALAVVAAGFFALYEAVERPGSGAFAAVVDRGRGDAVALTFDDGPTPGITDGVLDALERARVPATFFVVGRAVRAHPALIARMVRDGDGVGNHSQTHAHLNALPAPLLARELDDASAAIVAAGAPRPRWLRPPFGARNAAVIAAARARGMRVCTWSIETADAAAVRAGDIILLHDGSRGNGAGERSGEAAALPALLRGLRARGLRVVSLDELVSGVEAPA